MQAWNCVYIVNSKARKKENEKKIFQNHEENMIRNSFVHTFKRKIKAMCISVFENVENSCQQ